jgi:hypothetical protein
LGCGSLWQDRVCKVPGPMVRPLQKDET